MVSPSVSGMNLGVEATFGDPAPLRAFVFALLFMLPVLFLSGFFPAVVKMATRDINEAGHIFGKVLFWFTLEATRYLDLPGPPFTETRIAALRLAITGLMLILLMAFRPQGLFGKRQEMVLGE